MQEDLLHQAEGPLGLCYLGDCVLVWGLVLRFSAQKRDVLTVRVD